MIAVSLSSSTLFLFMIGAHFIDISIALFDDQPHFFHDHTFTFSNQRDFLLFKQVDYLSGSLFMAFDRAHLNFFARLFNLFDLSNTFHLRSRSSIYTQNQPLRLTLPFIQKSRKNQPTLYTKSKF